MVRGVRWSGGQARYSIHDGQGGPYDLMVPIVQVIRLVRVVRWSGGKSGQSG